MDTDAVAAATELYVYGYPLVYGMDEIAKLPAGESSVFPGVVVPFNDFGRARQLLGPSAEFVSPNNDTLYLIGPVDLSSGPVVLHVPDTHDRYYVMQFVDAWTNSFAYIGWRATGTTEATYLLVPPGYRGDVPADMQVLEVPSMVAVVVGRIQVDGEADLPAVHQLQDAFTLAPLGAHDGAAPAPTAGIPQPDPRVAGDLAFWDTFRVLLNAFQPPAADQPFLDLAAGLGPTATSSPVVDPDPAVSASLIDGQTRGKATIEQLASASGDASGGRSTAMHMFDYNLDRCGPGTIDSPE